MKKVIKWSMFILCCVIGLSTQAQKIDFLLYNQILLPCQIQYINNTSSLEDYYRTGKKKLYSNDGYWTVKMKRNKILLICKTSIPTSVVERYSLEVTNMSIQHKRRNKIIFKY